MFKYYWECSQKRTYLTFSLKGLKKYIYNPINLRSALKRNEKSHSLLHERLLDISNRKNTDFILTIKDCGFWCSHLLLTCKK